MNGQNTRRPNKFHTRYTKQQDTSDVQQPRGRNINTTLLTIFSGILAFSTTFSVWAFVQSERAFVFPTETNFATKLVPHIPFIPMYLIINNSGRATASIDYFVAGITHDLPPLPEYVDTTQFAWAPVVAGGTTKQVLRFETN
jgi:hypothetical protein